MYATPNDVAVLWRPLTEQEEAAVQELIPIVESQIRIKARDVGRNLDLMAAEPDYAEVLKSVIVDVVKRYLSSMGNSTMDGFSQMSQSALGYTFSGTFATPGGGVSVMRNDLKRLGLLRQRYGVIDFC